MTRRIAAVLTATLALAACGAEATAPPAGFATLEGDGWTVAYPHAWTTTTAQHGIRLAQGPKQTGDLAPQVAVASDPKPPPFQIALDAFRIDQTVRRGDYTITTDAAYEIDGAKAARLIEATYTEQNGTRVRSVDLLVRTDDDKQLDFLIRAPQADFDRARLDEVIDTIRLK